MSAWSAERGERYPCVVIHSLKSRWKTSSGCVYLDEFFFLSYRLLYPDRRILCIVIFECSFSDC